MGMMVSDGSVVSVPIRMSASNIITSAAIRESGSEMKGKVQDEIYLLTLQMLVQFSLAVDSMCPGDRGEVGRVLHCVDGLS